MKQGILNLLAWCAWESLHGAWRSTTIPALSGLYRIVREGQEGLDYIGQTGTGAMMLRARLGMLRGIYGSQMPYRDPHTAGPALWALHQLDARPFLVSIVPVEGSAPWRKGLECVAISLYRQERQRSPTVNFGRMPVGYRMSSGNNARLHGQAVQRRAKRGARRQSSLRYSSSRAIGR